MKYLLSFTVIALMSLTFTICWPALASDAVPKRSPEGSTKITLAIGSKIVPAVLYNNPTAKDLITKLPVTVFLNRYERDYCGGITPLHYEEKYLHTGYHNGELAYWPQDQDFVIFVEKEETSNNESPTVIIGEVTCDIKEIRDLENCSIKVTIALDE